MYRFVVKISFFFLLLGGGIGLTLTELRGVEAACTYQAYSPDLTSVSSELDSAQTTLTVWASGTTGQEYTTGCAWRYHAWVSSYVTDTSVGSSAHTYTTGTFSDGNTLDVSSLSPGTYTVTVSAQSYYGSPNFETMTTSFTKVDTTPPSTPGTLTSAWTRDHYVNGNFVVSTTGSTDNLSVKYYWYCRSQDSTGGWRGCESWMSHTGGTSFTVQGADLPSPGAMRWYYVYAVDYAGNMSPSSSGVYIRMDNQIPTYNEVTFSGCNYENGSDCWLKSGQTFYVNIKHTENPVSMNVGTNTQYLELTRNNLSPGSWTPSTGNIKSHAQPYGTASGALYSSFSDGTGPMTDNVHADIQSVECLQSGGCSSVAYGKWKVVAGNDTETFATGTAWTASSNVSFSISQGGRTTVRLGSPAWQNITSNMTYSGAKRFTMDFYPNVNNGTPHPLALDGSGYRSGIIYGGANNQFKAQVITPGGGYTEPFTFPLAVTKNSWYTTDVAYNGDGTTTACVYASGGSPEAANCYTTSALFPANWNYQVKAWSDVNYTYLSNFKTAANYGVTTYLYDGMWQGVGYTQTGKWVKTDTFLPVNKAVTLSSNEWAFGSGGSTYNIVVKTSDYESGMAGGSAQVMALINWQGSNTANPRGWFSWYPSGYVFTLDQVPCTGGGYGSKIDHPFYNPSMVTLVGCSTTTNGPDRTVTFTVRPNANFGEFNAINDISIKSYDAIGYETPWQNFDLNFSSYKLVSITNCNFVPNGASAQTNGTLVSWVQACGGLLATFLRDADIPADTILTALQGASFPAVVAAFTLPNQAALPDANLKANGAIYEALRAKTKGYVCDAKLNRYNRSQIVTAYHLNDLPFSFSPTTICN